VRAVPTAQVWVVWPMVKKWFERVIERSGEPISIEDVYYWLRSGKAALYIIGEDDGCIVVMVQEFADGPVLFVWGFGGDAGLITEHRNEIIGWLKETRDRLGCKRVVMQSKRKGWKALGWKPARTVYELED